MWTKKCARYPECGPKSARGRFRTPSISRRKPYISAPTKRHQTPEGYWMASGWRRNPKP